MLYTVTFDKVFVSGTLEGIRYADKISHVSSKFVAKLLERMEAEKIVKPAAGGSEYRIENVKLIENIL